MDTFKEIAFIGAIAVGLIILIEWGNSDPGHHKYRIEYQGYKGMTYYDYTDSIIHCSDHIKYINPNGQIVEKYGTFSIKRQ